MKKRVSALLSMFLLATLSLFGASGTASASPDSFQVHFLDVGQGDCAVVLCDGESMIIDGGPKGASQYVYSYIRDTLKLTHIDYIISTHPHIDHVGGLASILNAVPADLLLTPTREWDSKAFNSMKVYANMQGTVIAVPNEGDTMQLGSAKITILHCWPEAIDLGRTNDASIVLRIDYGKNSFLFTGDAEDWAEYMMIDAGVNLKADVLKVSHHGSYTASTEEFLQEVRPEYAVISVGKNNEYGHPHAVVLNRLEKTNCTVLRTDEQGTVVLQSDGKSIHVLP